MLRVNFSLRIGMWLWLVCVYVCVCGEVMCEVMLVEGWVVGSDGPEGETDGWTNRVAERPWGKKS